jgi:hypothetical protein
MQADGSKLIVLSSRISAAADLSRYAAIYCLNTEKGYELLQA